MAKFISLTFSSTSVRKSFWSWWGADGWRLKNTAPGLSASIIYYMLDNSTLSLGVRARAAAIYRLKGSLKLLSTVCGFTSVFAAVETFNGRVGKCLANYWFLDLIHWRQSRFSILDDWKLTPWRPNYKNILLAYRVTATRAKRRTFNPSFPLSNLFWNCKIDSKSRKCSKKLLSL